MVQVDAREIAHHQQVEVAVVVEIDEAARVAASEPFRSKPRSLRGLREVPVSVVQQQVAGMTVVGIVVR